MTKFLHEFMHTLNQRLLATSGGGGGCGGGGGGFLVSISSECEDSYALHRALSQRHAEITAEEALGGGKRGTPPSPLWTVYTDDLIYSNLERARDRPPPPPRGPLPPRLAPGSLTAAPTSPEARDRTTCFSYSNYHCMHMSATHAPRASLKHTLSPLSKALIDMKYEYNECGRSQLGRGGSGYRKRHAHSYTVWVLKLDSRSSVSTGYSPPPPPPLCP
ncbi:unnamed protein product [Plutella xylostella]|uniref:(diamondback moth) hypothetical protein n=1 Tax=Plutella xylostella TaxID=51655 RepID=A0A8S4FLY7_PLUXY|nr:unnamed protein product [Plutella xylostella]